MKAICSILLILIGSAFMPAHKFYMSITEMEYNAESKNLEVMVKLFTEDLELALEKESNLKLYLATPKEHIKTDSLIHAYLRNNFAVKQNNSELIYDFLGKESDQDYTWLYIEVMKFKPKESHELKNSLLIDYFDEQKNQVNYYHQGETKTLSLHKGLTSERF